MGKWVEQLYSAWKYLFNDRSTISVSSILAKLCLFQCDSARNAVSEMHITKRTMGVAMVPENNGGCHGT